MIDLEHKLERLIYAPIHLKYNKLDLLAEARAIPDSMFDLQKTYWHGGNIETALKQLDGLVVGTMEENMEFPRQFVEDGELKFAGNTDRSFKVLHLTHVPEEPLSLKKAVRFENGNFLRLRVQYFGKWVLRDDIVAPQIFQFVETLPFDELSLVRLCVYEPGSFTPAHKDEPNRNYKNLGCHIINFILSSGGANMVLRVNGNDHVANDSSYLFDFSLPHGVPPVETQRIVLCVEGKINFKKLNEIIDWQKAIFLPNV